MATLGEFLLAAESICVGLERCCLVSGELEVDAENIAISSIDGDGMPTDFFAYITIGLGFPDVLARVYVEHTYSVDAARSLLAEQMADYIFTRQSKEYAKAPWGEPLLPKDSRLCRADEHRSSALGSNEQPKDA